MFRSVNTSIAVPMVVEKTGRLLNTEAGLLVRYPKQCLSMPSRQHLTNWYHKMTLNPVCLDVPWAPQPLNLSVQYAPSS